jgi:hypothetical protein
MRPTISNPRKKIARRDATPRRAKIQFDDGGNITVSAFDRNDICGPAICNQHIKGSRWRARSATQILEHLTEARHPDTFGPSST